jgi:hypothetical protein
MLEYVTAVRFDRRLGSGKTWPCLLSCAPNDADGDEQEQEVVAKFSHGCERQVGGLVAEAIAAMLAADLNLTVPKPLLVQFDAEFVELIRLGDPDLAQRAAHSVPIAFGSSKLPPGFVALPRDKSVPYDLRAQAAEILAFDALIQNPDRRPVNPNCLLDGRSFAIFDHEFAFVTHGIIGWRPPWLPNALDGMMKGAGGHVFFAGVRGTAPDLDRLRGAWRAISDGRLREYRQALPPAWHDDGGVADDALAYVAQVRDNIDSAVVEVLRVLS